MTTSWPGRVWSLTAIWFPIEPVGTKSAASFSKSSAARSCRRLTVGSSPYTSSPTSASAIARRIEGVGLVTVSLLKSMNLIGGFQSQAEEERLGARAALVQLFARDDGLAPLFDQLHVGARVALVRPAGAAAVEGVRRAAEAVEGRARPVLHVVPRLAPLE